MNRQATPVFFMVTAVLMLTGLGLVMISSTAGPLKDGMNQFARQLIWFAVSLGAFCVVGWADYRKWRPLAWALFILSVFLLVLVFVPHLGRKVKGAYRWLDLPGFKIQPSEFLRITVVLLLAHGLSKLQPKIKDWKWGIAWPLGVLAVPLGLLALEPDFGTLGLLLATAFAMMFVAGVRVWPLAGLGGAGLAGLGLMLWMIPNRRARILAFLNPEMHKEGMGYQIYQGKLALGAGGLEGLGLGNSRQKMGYLPEAMTDMILPIVGEELGFYITVLVVVAYMVILVGGIWIALRAADTFGLLLGMGLVFGLVLQAMVNIATVTAMMPPKGMPLPFVSYGGSNLLISYAAIGLLVSIHRHSLRAKRYVGGVPFDQRTPDL